MQADISTRIVDGYRNAVPFWQTAVMPFAVSLFWSLAGVSFAWSMILHWLQQGPLSDFLAVLFRKVVILGIFFTILLNGPLWTKYIIQSIQQVGQAGSLLPTGISPGDVVFRGGNLAATLMSSASGVAFLKNPAAGFVAAIASILIVVSFCLIAGSYIIALVEGYLALSAGLIFLGLGGASFTQPYVDRYIGLAISIGVKIMCFYFLIGVGMQEVARWSTDLSLTANPIDVTFDVLGSSLIFLMLAFQIPKFFATVLGGTPHATLGDFIGTTAAAVYAGVSVASTIGGAIVGGATAAAGAIGGGSAAGGGAAAGGAAAGGGAQATPAAVAPPGGGGGGGSNGSGGGKGGGGAMARLSRMSDQHHPPSPPQMTTKGD